jgi:hypothetical protein
MRRLLRPLIAALAAVAGLFAIIAATGAFAGSDGGLASAASPAQQIGMRVLVITSSTDATTGDGAAYADWVNTLNREGVPFDTVVTSSQGLPALSSTGSDGTQIANYEGVIVAGSGLEGMTNAQWATLQTFEQQFSVRQLTANAVPGPDYGLNTPANGGDSALPSSTLLSLTTDGQSTFPYLNSIALDSSYPTFGAETTVASNPGGTVDTLVSGPGNSTMLGIYITPDGRQTMFQTFNMGPGYLQSELVRHGELAWLGRNTYFGDQRNYLETDIDDNFLSDDVWSTTTHSTDYNPADALREVPADVTTAANWSASTGVRIDMLFNGGGSQQYSEDNGGAADPLVAAFQATKGDFGWINHTWDHPNIDQGCANAAYIESELTKNTSWATTTLGLASGTAALGTQNPAVVVTGEHSGLANLIPGNPGTVDPPEFNAVTPTAGTTTFAAGSYTYAITDDFVTGGGQSSASETPVTLTAGQQVSISWDPVCHAANYYIYRQNPDLTWTLVKSQPATSSDFGDSGPAEISFTDTNVGTATTTVPSATVNNATETPYGQNTNLPGAFNAVGVTAFGSDASKPYPNPATGNPPLTSAQEAPAGSTFTDGNAQAVPRYPTNIYYNVSTQAQETDEFNTLYQAPPAGICNAATTACITTPWSFQQIIDSIVGVNGPYLGMFQHMMGNDPRPDYFHQTNMMSQTGAANATGNGLYYTVMNELLRTYNQYFKANAPIEQLTMADIATLLSEQGKWLGVNRTQVTGSIEGNAVTLNNSGSALELPLTGMTTVGSDYAGSHSGWTLAPAGKSTYTAQTAWPAPPVVPVIVTVPTGPAPTLGPGQTTPKPQPGSPPAPKGASKPPAPAIVYLAVQAAPKTVRVSHGKVTVSLSCKASKGRTAKGKLCAGTFTLTVAGQKVSHSFRFKSGKVSRITVKLPKLSMSAVTAAAHHKPKARKMAGKLVITTKLSAKSSRSVKGSLTING